MSKVGLVLGGGGVTGASFHFGTLLALEMATGWNASHADVIVGTSCGSVVAALARGDQLNLESLVGDVDGEDELIQALSRQIYRRARPRGVLRWMRHGLLPGLRDPGLKLALGSPAPYSTDGIAEWLEELMGEAALEWPDRPTLIVGFELGSKRRVAFGTEDSPDADLKTAVAASSAVPLVFEPVHVDGRWYVDGGVASGTNADLVLGSPDPLDLVIVIAPLAAEEREDARFYESIFDRVGGTALEAEIDAIEAAWPGVDVVVFRPDTAVLEETRPNPLSPARALPAFLTTLRSMRRQLSDPDVWSVIEEHLTKRRLPSGRRRFRDRVRG